MKDAVATMGDLLPNDAGGRDAVHVAVISAFSEMPLKAGDHVALLGRNEEGDAHVIKDKGNAIGIVDPFLSRKAPAGSRFWLYLYPRTITGLSHKWTHPAFEDVDEVYYTPQQRMEAETWLADWCERNDTPGYQSVKKKIEEWLEGSNDEWNDEYIHFDGQDAHGEIPEEFWEKVQVMMGKELKGNKPRYFSCSC